MSVYSKSVSDISTDDLREILSEHPVENVRLEFKSEQPTRDEFLKKVSSLANTYGGLVVLGALATSADGKLQSLPGVVTELGLKQRLVQWAFDGLAPPLEVLVSQPVSTPSDSTKVCYVVSVPESLAAPHFINGRKGAYVRTDEFSGRFEAQLATYEEIAHLANRRSLSIARRDQLLRRAEDRVSALEHKREGNLEALLSLFVCPAYPSRNLIAQDRLFNVVHAARIQWRSMGFPIISQGVSQHESALLLEAAGEFSVLEATTWGSLFVAASVQGQYEGTSYVNLHRLVGVLLASIGYAGRLCSSSGFDGLLWLRPCLHRIAGLPLNPGAARSVGGGSPIDNTVEFDLLVSSDRLKSERDAVAVDILRTLCFALNWHALTSADPKLDSLLDIGYEHNMWPPRT